MSRNGIATAPAARIKCKATSKNKKGQPCGNWAVHGRTVCRLHGGTQPVGLESPNFKHGRYSKYLPHELKARYELALSDSNLLAMRDDIALMDARLANLFEKVADNESPVLWMQVRQAYRELVDAKEVSVSVIAEKRAMDKLAVLVEQGSSDMEAWQSIHDTVEQRRKLAESERKRLIDLKQMIPAERVSILLSAVRETVRMAVMEGCSSEDEARSILARISLDIVALSNIPDTYAPRVAMKELTSAKD